MFRKDLRKPDGRRLYLYSRTPISDEIIPTNPPHEPINDRAHMRWHPLRGEWVAYASHRQNRTFLPPAEYSPLAVTKSPDFPTELPAGKYEMAVFENLFASLAMTPEKSTVPSLSVETKPGEGVCEVVVFSQDPKTSLAEMSVDEVALVLEVLGDRTRDIGSRPEIQYVLAFENRGVEVGVTLHHPHGQIYAYPFVPPVPARMLEMQKKYFVEKNRTLVGDMVKNEAEDGRRMIVDGKHSKAFIPVCARYPYETWIAPVRAAPFLHELNTDERLDLARTLKTVLLKFDRMWNRPFPYLLSLFQGPTDGLPHPEAHVHFQIFPPYRTKDKLKYLAGTEIAAGMFVNDSLPEEKAVELRDVNVEMEMK